MRNAVFLDRDGVINQQVSNYLTKPEQFVFLEGSIEAITRLSHANFVVIVVTNQSAVGRGLLTIENLEAIHELMLSEVEKHGGHINAICVCTHLPEENCACRKPNTLLVEIAKSMFSIDLKNSWFVGDKTTDIQTGKNAGCKTILVKSGYGGTDGLYDARPDYISKDLSDAANIILGKNA